MEFPAEILVRDPARFSARSERAWAFQPLLCLKRLRALAYNSPMDSIAECRLELGRRAEAPAIWEKSLQISPDQERIRTLVESLKESK